MFLDLLCNKKYHKVVVHNSLLCVQRGCGLFLGVELVSDRESRMPATAEAAHVISRYRQFK